MIRLLKALIQYGPIVFVLTIIAVDTIVPNSLWFRVARVQVSDSLVGIAPKMVVAREVARPFRANWLVTVKKAQDETETSLFYSACTAGGEGDYRPETALPINLDLNWWTFPRECNLQPGSYIIDTSWTFHVMFMERTVRVVSNVFVIK